MTHKFSVSDIIPAGPEEIYAAWLDSKAHGAMTGAAAKATAKVGGAFSAWDGYAYGTNLELVPGKKIVQSWRTTDFAEGDKDSKLTVTLKPVAGGAGRFSRLLPLMRAGAAGRSWTSVRLAIGLR